MATTLSLRNSVVSEVPLLKVRTYVHVEFYIPFEIRNIIYINQTGDEPQQQDTQANTRTPLLREEFPYQITLIGLRQGSLDRRREKIIWEMFTENDCNTFADLKGES